MVLTCNPYSAVPCTPAAFLLIPALPGLSPPQSALVGAKAALTRLKGSSGGAAGSHTWLRLALVSGDKSAAALYDDPTQAGVARASKRSTAAPSGSSASWVATIQAAGGLVRTNIPMKNTILRIALTNKKQVRPELKERMWVYVFCPLLAIAPCAGSRDAFSSSTVPAAAGTSSGCFCLAVLHVCGWWWWWCVCVWGGGAWR